MQTPLTQALLDQARDLIRKGESIRQAAKVIGFHESTLRSKLKSGIGTDKLGRFRTVFSKKHEEELVEHCKALDRRFFGLTLKSLRFLLYQFAEKNKITHRFSRESKMAGRDFTRQFMKRNRLSLRTPRKTSVARMMGFNRTQVMTYFENLEQVMVKYKFTPDRLYNMDETGVQTVPNKLPKHVAPTGKREVAKSVSAEQGQTVTAVCAMNATGHHVPPFFIFKRKRLNPLLMRGGPTGCDMAVTEKGYMNSPTFITWLEHFKKFTNPTKENPILLILDNHISHTTLQGITWAKKNNVHLLTLPPHSSHKTQPLDRIFFRPFKAFYDDASDDWTATHPGQVLSIYHVAELVAKAFEKAATVEKAVNGFRTTGIYPLDRNIFSEDDFLPSEVTDQLQEEMVEDANDVALIVFDGDGNETSDKTLLIPNTCPIDEESACHTQGAQLSHHSLPELEMSVEGIESDEDSAVDQNRTYQHSSPGPSMVTSPRDIIPIPKVGFKRKRTGRGLKSTLLTSTPNKKRMEAQEDEKRDLEIAKQERKKKRAAKRTLFSNDGPKSKKFGGPKSKKFGGSRKKFTMSSSEEESDFSIHNSSSDSNFLSEEENDPDIDLLPGDFALVKVFGDHKKSFRLYVSRITTLDEDNKGYDVVWFKRSPKTLKFTETEEEAFVFKEEIVLKLSKPVSCSSARFHNMLTFTNDLSMFTIY